jgi:ferritin-like metal-binding protein YciE
MKSQQLDHEYSTGLTQAKAAAANLIPTIAELARAADDTELAESLRDHANELSRQVDRLSEISPTQTMTKDDEVISALATKASTTIAENPQSPIRDIAMIAAMQHIQHYQIATFGTLAAYAKMLGRHNEKRVLGALLEDERALDEDLSVIATMILDPHDQAVAA